MTDETKKLFNAPWKAVEMVDTNFPYLHECEIVSNNGNGHMIATEVLRADANRLARLPELYDALVSNTYDRCANVRASLRCYPLTIEEFIRGDCDCDIKCAWGYCKTWELLRKVRDGE